jgi:hypothetical protein
LGEQKLPKYSNKIGVRSKVDLTKPEYTRTLRDRVVIIVYEEYHKCVVRHQKTGENKEDDSGSKPSKVAEAEGGLHLEVESG